MRTFGLCASLLATTQLLMLTSPALAADTETATPPKSEEAAKPATDRPVDAEKPAATSSAPAAQTSQEGDGTVLVHIDSPQAVTLESRTPGTTSPTRWEPVCTSPCDARASVSAEYHVVGTGLNESKPFLLDASKAKITLTVSPGVHKMERTGLWVLAGGGGLILVGAIVILAGANAKTDTDGTIGLANTSTIFVGEALMIAGAAGGILGGAWMLDNAHTGVAGDVSSARGKPSKDNQPGGPPANGTVKISASMRQPIFDAPKSVSMPGFLSVPLYVGKF